MGFRGSEGQGKLASDDPREKYRVEHDIPGYENPEGRRRSEKRNYERKDRKEGPWGERGRGDSQSKRDSRSPGAFEERDSTWKDLGKSGAGEARSWHGESGRKSGRPEERSSRREDRGSSGRPEENKASSSTTQDLRIRLGKRLIAGEENQKETYAGKASRSERPERSYNSNSERNNRFAERGERSSINGSRFKDRDTRGSGRTRDPSGRTQDRSERSLGSSSGRSFGQPTDTNAYGTRFDQQSSEPSASERYPSLSFNKARFESKYGDSSSNETRSWNKSGTSPGQTSSDRSTKYGTKAAFEGSTASPRRGSEDSSSRAPKFVEVADKRIPLSIPYTTPASEFLYGTSVVEAALNSGREPRRKLYKLYIYNGENREDAGTDAKLERLARRKGVDVVKAGNEWLRVMDKMSGGRPHNGYILETSPLPRVPVTSLGQLTTIDDCDGFEVCIDYQSREEAEVNGTSTFYKTSRNRSGRKPLVLLLDSIVDPGNLGGIIRTAAFLGVSAIAISARNSAPFTPVVLKASAGASEDITLFTVNKPAGFVVDSKNAGWKIFAAVAPTRNNDAAMPASISTDELTDPLSEDPCILMLGSEGEGLRENLRTKADVELYIEGSRHSHNVDSLNVSVAAGVLCNAFLGRRKPTTVSPIQQSQQELKEEAPMATGQLF